MSDTEPTIRQKLVFDKVLKGASISPTMREVGYSKATSKTTGKLTNSKGWQKLLQRHLPDSHLGKKHREFLDAPRQVRTYRKGELEVETEETDPSAVKALDMAYKLKGRYENNEGGNKVLIINISGQSATRYGTHTSTS